jgi:hypothetical protein
MTLRVVAEKPLRTSASSAVNMSVFLRALRVSVVKSFRARRKGAMLAGK